MYNNDKYFRLGHQNITRVKYSLRLGPLKNKAYYKITKNLNLLKKYYFINLFNIL